MILFFNDSFLEREYVGADEAKFQKSCESLFLIYNEIKNKKLQFSSQRIIVKSNKTAIEAFFKEIKNKDLETIFLKSLANVNAKFWDEDEKVQSEEYYYNFYNTLSHPPVSENISKTSLAEAAELIKRGDNCVLTINLPDLFFSGHYQLGVNISSIVDSQDISFVLVNCTDNCNGVAYWIDSYWDEKLKYKDFSRTPLDEETCLSNQQKFKKVNGLKSQGRQVYLDVQKRFWYIDNLHKGESTHLEVFNKDGKHIGEADLKGIINFSKKVEGRIFVND